MGRPIQQGPARFDDCPGSILPRVLQTNSVPPRNIRVQRRLQDSSGLGVPLANQGELAIASEEQGQVQGLYQR